MDLSQYLQNGESTLADSGGQLSKEEYAAMKKQEREEVWAEVDSKAQEVFQDGESLKGFLNFMARCKPQKAANLLLLYGQNPEIRQVKTFDGWKKEHKTLRAGAHGYTFIADQKYEKDGETRQGYVICKAYDISQIRTKQPEPPEPKPIQTLMGALLKDTETKICIADNLPDQVQAQYIPRERTIYVRNGMSEEVTFHAINREPGLRCHGCPRRHIQPRTDRPPGVLRGLCHGRKVWGGPFRVPVRQDLSDAGLWE